MTRIILTLALILGGLGLTACNTIEGAGEDIQAGGEAISDTAKNTGEAISGE